MKHFNLEIDAQGIAIVTLDVQNEKVNTLSPALHSEFEEVISTLEGEEVQGAVIRSGKSAGFIAGADIQTIRSAESQTEATELAKRLQQTFDRLAAVAKKKPVIAAIHGACLGGGLELALACTGRIASAQSSTVLGLPEVQLGLIPGAGGTQRLPRLIGLTGSLDLILTGRRLRANKAKKLGLVDAVVPPPLLTSIATEYASKQRSLPKRAKVSLDFKSLGKGPDVLKSLGIDDNWLVKQLVFKQAREALLKKTQGNYPAPEAAIEVIKTGLSKGMKAGLNAEADHFGRLAMTSQSKNLVRLFFDSQEIKKDLGTKKKVEPRPIKDVGMVGGGLMGGGIASVCVRRAKSRVRIKDIHDEGVRGALKYVYDVVQKDRKRKRISHAEAERMMHQVSGTIHTDGFEKIPLLIEAVFEDLELKRRVLKEFEALTGPDTIFASNTSSLPIGHIAEAAQRPENVIGMHYFSPVEKMPLLEVIVTPHTADWVTATCVRYGQQQGKTVIVVNDGTGFYTSRILAPYMNEAAHLLSEGADIEGIDAALEAFGFPVGPVTLMDEVGIDVGYKVGRIMFDAFGDRMRTPALFDAIIQDGRKGRKNNKGFYRYSKGKKDGVDTKVYSIIRGGEAKAKKIPNAHMQERCALQLINESVRCLEEGILRSARDGDLGAVMGLGFPPFRGGPFAYIDQVGADYVVERMQRLVDTEGERFTPADLLLKHAKTKQPFRTR